MKFSFPAYQIKELTQRICLEAITNTFDVKLPSNRTLLEHFCCEHSHDFLLLLFSRSNSTDLLPTPNEFQESGTSKSNSLGSGWIALVNDVASQLKGNNLLADYFHEIKIKNLIG